MEALPEHTARRRRYVRHPTTVSLTPPKLRLLQYIADFQIVNLPQLARLTDLSEKSTRRHCRELFDMGLVEVVAVPRAALADPESGPNDASVLFGSAPNIYTVTRAGLKLLYEQGRIEVVCPAPRYGPKNSLFLAHELAIRDVRVWLELAARGIEAHEVLRWEDGADAHIDLNRAQPPKLVCPDAWFVYRLGSSVLVGLVEVDRGTERGGRRWLEKITAYDALFSGGRLCEVTGYARARVLVITPSARRRDHLAEFIETHAPAPLAPRFWLAERSVLTDPVLSVPLWRQPGSSDLKPLIPPMIPDSQASAG